MQYTIPESDVLAALKSGVKHTTDFIASLTDFHGGPVTTEYLITSDIARELMKRHFDVRVEYLNRKLVNSLVRKKLARPKTLGAKRTDVAVVLQDLVPLVMIEVKIGVRTLRSVRKDLDKITDTMAMLDARYAAHLVGVSLFQIHIPGSNTRYKVEHFDDRLKQILNNLKTDLHKYATRHAEMKFNMHALQEGSEGIVASEIEMHGDGNTPIVSRRGHATCYFAILLRSIRPVPQQTMAQLKGGPG